MSAQGSCLCATQRGVEENGGVKMILRLVTVLFAFIGFVLEIVFKASDSGSGPYTLFFSPQAIACLAISMLWCIANVVFLHIRKQSIHPGIHVAIDLLILVGLMSAAITQLVLSATYWNNQYESYLNPTCYAAATVTILTSLFHATFFVWACIDTDRLRNGKGHWEPQPPCHHSEGAALPNIQALEAYEIPQGMVLISVETLAQLHQKQQQPVYEVVHDSKC